MVREQFEKAKAWLHAHANDIANAKRPGYTQGNTDVLKNFKRVADAIPCECPKCGYGFTLNPGQVWAVYLLKHVDALISGLSRPNLPQAEALEGRFADMLNYGDLGFGIAVEQALESPTPAQPAPMSAPGIAPQPRPQSAPGTALPPQNPVASNILPWKQKSVSAALPGQACIPTHQHGHLTTSEAPEAVQLPLPFESFVEFPIEDDSVVDYGDRDEIDRARVRLEIANTKPQSPIS
jgi:hypothetical protein